jgi:hypothetical protein
MSRSSVSRAISRRTGSKQERSTASGVSSMMRLTPVTDSKARMFRPSRPMMRPFISSLGRWSTETTDSLVCSVATRWMASVTIFLARLSPSDLASCSMSLTMSAASRLAWFSMVATSSVLACSAVRPAIRSSSRPRSASARSSSAARWSRSCLRWSSPRARFSMRFSSSSRRCSRSARRTSRRSRSLRSSRTSSLTARISSSTSRRPWAVCSASSRARPRIPAASVSARARMCSASFSSWLRSPGVLPGTAEVPADRRHTTTSANTAASNPITMNASDNPLFTVTPFRHGPRAHSCRDAVTRFMP